MQADDVSWWIRDAALADVDAIAVIHHESYLSSAVGLLPPERLALRTVEYRRALWAEKLSKDRGPSEATLVADDGATVGAFVDVSPSEDDPHLGEVNKLFVAPDMKGRGVGARLLRAGTQRLAEARFSEMMLWVLVGNAPAAAFYRRHGWRPTGRLRHFSIDQTGASLPAEEYRLSI